MKAGGRKRKSHRTKPKSENVYLKLLVKLYRFLERRVDSAVNGTILKRLFMSKQNRPPMSLSKLNLHMKGRTDKVAAVVGTVTDDVRMLEVPPMKVWPLGVGGPLCRENSCLCRSTRIWHAGARSERILLCRCALFASQRLHVLVS